MTSFIELYYISFQYIFFLLFKDKKQATPWPGKTPHKDSTRLPSVTSKAPYTHCPANISCFPSSHKKKTQSTIDAHEAPPRLSLIHSHMHRQAALLKAAEGGRLCPFAVEWS